VTATASLRPPNEYHARITTNMYTEDVTIRCEVGDLNVGTDSFSLQIGGGDATTGWVGVLHGGHDEGRFDDDVPIRCSFAG
jgi:hypothetical protein